MMIRSSLAALLVASATTSATASAPVGDEEAPRTTVSPVPLTREDMKRALEDSKHAEPRLPLPPLTEEERARAEEAAAQPADGRPGLGRGIVNNGRMRSYYLSDYNTGRSSTAGARQPVDRDRDRDRERRDSDDPSEYAFNTMLFWIVSRGNNCTYCMGHQESKLASAGLSDDEIATLDGNWDRFNPAHQAAFAFTKKLSFAPHELTDADIDALREHYSEDRILQIIQSIAGFNAMNRWTGPIRIPQEERHVFLKPTSSAYLDVISRVAPASSTDARKGFVPPRARSLPPLESRDRVKAALEAARHREPRLSLASPEAARVTLSEVIGDREPTNWMRLYASPGQAGAGRVATQISTEQNGSLDPRLKAIIFYTAARHDRAWYALGHAIDRLKALGFSEDEIFALDDPSSISSPIDREIVTFARTIAVDPSLVSDEDFLRLRDLLDDKKVAEAVYQTSQAAAFNRVTEAAGLPLER